MRLKSLVVALVVPVVACTTNQTPLGEQRDAGGDEPVIIHPPNDGGVGTSPDAGLPCEWTQTQGFESAVVNAVAADSKQVLAGTARGLFRSTDGAKTWSAVAGFPQDPVKSLVITEGGAFAVAVDDQAATHVYRSTDGLTWTLAELGLNQASPAIELISTGGRLVATAGGSGFEWSPSTHSWSALDAPTPMSSFAFNGTTEVIVMGDGTALQFRQGPGAWTDALTSQEAGRIDRVWTFGTGFAAAAQNGLYVSQDGKTFTKASLPAGETGVPDAILPGVDDIVASFTSGVYRSHDGSSWTRLGDASDGRWISGVRALATDGASLYAGTFEGVKTLTAGASAWTSANKNLNGAHVRAMAVVGPYVYASAGQDRIWQSKDFGETWAAGPVLQKDAQITSLGRAAGAIFAGTDGFGIYRTTDDGDSFQAVNSGVPTYDGSAGTQFREVNGIAGNGEVVVAALSSGAIRSTNGGESWEPANNGLPIVGFDSSNQPIYPGLARVFEFNGVLLASSSEGGLYRSADGAASWSPANEGIPLQSSGHPAEMTGVAKLGSTVFAGGKRWDNGLNGVLLRSTNDGDSWTDISATLPAGFFVADLSTNGGQLYALLMHAPAQPEDGVYVSQDGTRWDRVGGPTGVRALKKIALSNDRLLLGTDGRSVLSVRLTQCKF